MIGLPVPGALLPALAILTVLGAVTLAQRVWSALIRVVAAEADRDAIAIVGAGGQKSVPVGEPRRTRARPSARKAEASQTDAGVGDVRLGEDARVDEMYRRVGSLAEVPEGELRSFDLPGLRVAIAHIENELFVFGDECTHEDARSPRASSASRRTPSCARATRASSTWRPGSPSGTGGRSRARVHGPCDRRVDRGRATIRRELVMSSDLLPQAVVIFGASGDLTKREAAARVLAPVARAAAAERLRARRLRAVSDDDRGVPPAHVRQPQGVLQPRTRGRDLGRVRPPSVVLPGRFLGARCDERLRDLPREARRRVRHGGARGSSTRPRRRPRTRTSSTGSARPGCRRTRRSSWRSRSAET